MDQISLQSHIVGYILFSDVAEVFGFVASVSLMYNGVGALIHESVGDGL